MTKALIHSPKVRMANAPWKGTMWGACGKKRRYADEHEAMREANKRTAVTGTTLRVYDCVNCMGWHMTRQEIKT